MRRLGSVGQGDLGPMADLAHGLLTHSRFEVAENEGLALVSGNAFTTAWACIATADAGTLSVTGLGVNGLGSLASAPAAPTG